MPYVRQNNVKFRCLQAWIERLFLGKSKLLTPVYQIVETGGKIAKYPKEQSHEYEFEQVKNEWSLRLAIHSPESE